jgi:hypothetical protein
LSETAGQNSARLAALDGNISCPQPSSRRVSRAGLTAKGISTDDEFEAKKKQVLGIQPQRVD